MTKRQREALKLAMEVMRKEMKACAFDANAAMLTNDPPPHMQKQLAKHKELAAAMQTIEEMIRGVQQEMEL